MDKWDKKYVDFRPTLISHEVGISHSTACNEIAIEIRGVSEANVWKSCTWFTWCELCQ